MGDHEPGRAVEPPTRYALPRRARRSRRRTALAGVSGILLFACMFLPAIKGCSDPVMPYELPPFVPPYLYGLVFALLALSRSSRALVLGVRALRVLAVFVVAGSVVLIVVVPPVGLVELVAGGVLLVIIGFSDITELRVAMTGIAVGLISTIWFGFWSATPDALAGVYLSLASSIGLVAGSLAWLCEILGRPSVEVPLAIAARSPRSRWPRSNDIVA
jgi:hypothetical protein